MNNQQRLLPPSPVSASGLPLKGEPLQIVVATNEHLFELDEKCLEDILLKPDVRNKKVAIISVAGAFRKGKSFLLDFFLRYLSAKGSSDWLGSDDSPLEGFSWRGGSERDTTGILLWSEPFFCRMHNGEEIVILLMDTQGAFDSASTVKDCATIFALSTMIASSQVYNLSQNIQEDDLQHLQLFTEYGRLALEDNDNSSKPFQVLQFLIRDWSFPYEANYGASGGQEILNRRLQVSDNQHVELQQVRRHINSCFQRINCFLMPHPGLLVATNPYFDGRLKDVDLEFRKQLQILVPMVLAAENLVLKEINGTLVTAHELVEYFKAYIKIYQGEELPEPKTMLQATAEANNLAAVSTAKALYCREMEEVCGIDKPYLNSSSIEQAHERIRQKCLDHFHMKKKMGGPQFCQAFEEKLMEEIISHYSSYVRQNDSKSVISTFCTPVVLLVTMLLLYLSSSLLSFVGLQLAPNVLMWFFLLLSAFWLYAKFSGMYAKMAFFIDECAMTIWEQVLCPAYTWLIRECVWRTVHYHSQPGSTKKSA